MNYIKISVVQKFGSRLSKAEAKDFLDLLVENLKIANKKNILLIIDLDGASGYSDNFLEESFGALCRLDLFDSIQILGYLELVSNEHELIKKIRQIIGDALGWPRIIDLYMPGARDRTEN
jgi:hypothetical protein